MSGKNKGGTALVQKQRTAKTKQPPMYRVMLLNDDYTPMDFVVIVLERIFGFNAPAAVSTMLQVHQKGRAVCGVYSRDVAETKVSQVNDFSRQREYPLLCIMEAVDD